MNDIGTDKYMEIGKNKRKKKKLQKILIHIEKRHQRCDRKKNEQTTNMKS